MIKYMHMYFPRSKKPILIRLFLLLNFKGHNPPGIGIDSSAISPTDRSDGPGLVLLSIKTLSQIYL